MLKRAFHRFRGVATEAVAAFRAEVGTSIVEAYMVYVVAEHVIRDGNDGAVHWDFCCSACKFAGLGTGGVAGVGGD
jgi:hypothetical protein